MHVWSLYAMCVSLIYDLMYDDFTLSRDLNGIDFKVGKGGKMVKSR